MAVPVDITPGIRHPVALTSSLDPGLSRWKWLVKWVLAIPHLVVLALLWPAFVVVTVIAGSSILITGRYPRSLFAFTSGVLRWTWRVSYYATTGGLGTDRWIYRVVAYVALMTDSYPPIRLDQGSHEPAPMTTPPSGTTVAPRHEPATVGAA